ncbi:hypothetical protein [Amycolatopsis jiangsuensis]|uniref:Uncharacterized protein n=1 Tax=Amycolatopsis jiangsuensis TaxID=1181879 RepID=A0A840J4Q4_9PSEU|nr:hypothetical protein [Amycolatopsis jiangsuensis]MBB4688388.1 hypothetical protein [Amycolatopsis jiangsuensis]
MAQELSGITDAMMKFNPQPPTGGLGGGSAGATGASGGMPEGAAFAQAEQQSAQEVQKFLENVKKGFGAYASIARTSADDYLRADQSGKSPIAKAGDLSPVKPGVPR